jgi:hypothetical protein
MMIMNLMVPILFANQLHSAEGFAVTKFFSLPPAGTRLHATQAETEAERLLRKARELREASQREEASLHANLIKKKEEKDAATDLIISQLFPVSGVDELVNRLRAKHLALETCVSIVERLHEREMVARGLEHVEPSLGEQVTFKRVAQADEAELAKIEGIVHDFISAAEVLDQELIDQKQSEGGKMTHAEIVHWGGGNIAGILKDKVNELGRAHDDQFKQRLQSFYDAANRKKHKDDIDGNSWRDDDVWKK